MEHHLKILPEHYTAVFAGLKTAELRKCDRDFKAGDMLVLHEWDGEYTDRYVKRMVIHVADVGAYLPGWVLLSMVPDFRDAERE